MAATSDGTLLFTESIDSESSLLWVKREDGDFYVETRSLHGASNVLIIPKDEAEVLSHWLISKTLG